MAVWRVEFDPGQLYFITTSAICHAYLFRRDVTKQIIVDSFAYMRSQGWLELNAFTVMPNHIHLIVRCQSNHPVSDVLRDFKKFTSKRIIGQYRAEGHTAALAFLQQSVKHPRKQEYAVWEDEYQAKNVYSANFLRQKLDYIHNNPLQPHWQLVDDPSDYLWSSARFYLRGEPAIIPIDDCTPLLI